MNTLWRRMPIQLNNICFIDNIISYYLQLCSKICDFIVILKLPMICLCTSIMKVKRRLLLKTKIFITKYITTNVCLCYTMKIFIIRL